MVHFTGTMRPRAVLLAAALFAAVATPLAAQQVTSPAPVEQAAATPAPVSAPTSPLPGPRVRDELRPVQPSFNGSREARVRQSDNTTISISTIAILLAVVLLVVLLVR